MNILIFIPDKDHTVGGIFQYINCLISMVGKADKKNTYYLYLRNNTELFTPFSKQFTNIICIPEKESGNNSSLYSWKEKLLKGILHVLKKIKITIKLDLPSSLDKIIQKYNIDIVHFPYQRFVKTKVPGITTMHDVQELYFPQYFSSAVRASRAVNYKQCIDEADKVIVSYQHIKQDIIRFFNKPENNIDVLLLSMDNLWFEKFLNGNNTQDVLKNPTTIPFLLCPAVTWEHKNHINLLKAIAYLKEEKSCIVSVVFTGEKTAHFTKILEPFIQNNNLENQIQFKGVVSDEELYQLFNSCTGVVVPTKYEAGSFPLMESILMEVPVICSNVTSLPETIGNDFYTFNPENIIEIAEKVELLYTSEAFRKQCLDDLKPQKDRLRTTDAFEKLINIYNELYENKKQKN